MAESTGWLNMSRGRRKSAERLSKRGPTQEEAQATKAKRDQWVKTWMEANRAPKGEALKYLPAHLAA